MGCDIHPHFEVRRNGVWTYHDYQQAHADGKYDDGSTRYNYSKLFDDPLYVGRNYSLFAILADVRNGVGFAGCDTGDPFVPIAAPRGLPADVTDRTLADYTLAVDDEDPYGDGKCSRENAERWVGKGYSTWVVLGKAVSGPDWHSASYFTLAELAAYDWARTTAHRGWVDPWNFDLWRKAGKPGTWCGGVSGQGIEHVSNAAMARLIDSGELEWAEPEPDADSYRGRAYTLPLQRSMRSWPLKPGAVGDAIARPNSPWHYTNVEWTEPYSKSAEKFVTVTMPAMARLGNPDDVRICFWFDN